MCNSINDKFDMMPTPVITPHGVLILRPSDDAATMEPDLAGRLMEAFAQGSGQGLLLLGADEVGSALPPVFSYWRGFASQYLAALCTVPGLDRSEAMGGVSKPAIPKPDDRELDRLSAAAPPMIGAEYLSSTVLAGLWQAIDAAFDTELAATGLSVQALLAKRHSAWNLLGRVHFNLAENRNDDEAPFAFLATYTTQLSAEAKPRHLPLGKAVQDYAEAGNRERLLTLLMPVQRAAKICPWLKAMVDSGEIYHPLRWTPAEALQFLKDVPSLEEAGVVARMPQSWRMKRPANPKVTATVGGKAPALLGTSALLDFQIEVTLDGEPLSKAEVEQLLEHTEGLVLFRGQWIEVDHKRLARTLREFEAVEARAADEGLSFGEAMRMLSGAAITGDETADVAPAAWSETVAGPWLAETLAKLRQPDALGSCCNPATSLKATLRPYQHAGVEWLYLLTRLRLGACLADDMGLGKTIQILSLLLLLKNEAVVGAARSGSRSQSKSTPDPKPSLLVVPASLLANWAAEIARFTPSLNALVAHPSAMPPKELQTKSGPNLAGVDLVITSYGFVARARWFDTISWRFVILDEAQAIKNPAAKQTNAVKALKADTRIALTGTPIENRLGDLWSIFDFLNPGLLGTAKQFSGFVKRLADRPQNPYGPLRELVRPYILRRLKTDKNIIADLPEKTEVKAYCPLSRTQAALYSQAVEDFEYELKQADGMKRRGLILTILMRLKQICNHPSQWLRDDAWTEDDSGKFARLRDIAEIAAARQEKALVFTQFKEITAPLAAFLGLIFGRPGLVLHGGTPVKRRKDLVRQFQEGNDVPFFVLSVKAGGAGLNLTAASHVVHFDRWWNPAVENQATDRAFRIGQTRNVLVHKFVCQGTIEEKIDQMIMSKSQLAGDFLEGAADMHLTELEDEDLLRLVALDLNAAMKEA